MWKGQRVRIECVVMVFFCDSWISMFAFHIKELQTSATSGLNKSQYYWLPDFERYNIYNSSFFWIEWLIFRFYNQPEFQDSKRIEWNLSVWPERYRWHWLKREPWIYPEIIITIVLIFSILIITYHFGSVLLFLVGYICFYINRLSHNSCVADQLIFRCRIK